MVSIAFRAEEEVGGDRAGEVHVEIWARRNTVSKGNFTAKSNIEAMKVATLQELGFNTGSRFRYDLKKRGEEADINVGKVEVSNVMGMRCVGIKYEGDKVRNVASKERGACDEGVSISLVLEASIGARSKEEMADDAAMMRTDVAGVAEVSMEELGTTPAGAGTRMSASTTPNMAANRLRKKVSRVRNNTPYMKLVFVARHRESGPLWEDSDESASMRE